MKKGLMKLLSIMLVLVMCISVIPINAQAKKVKKPKLSSKSVTLTVGKKKTLKLKNATKISKKKIKKVKWSSSKKGIVSLKVSGKYKQNCKVTAKKAGSTTVKLKYNGKTYKCKFVVKSDNVNSNTENKTEESTEKKTEESTEKSKDSTENKTEESTEKSTEKSTEGSTEKPTESSIESSTESPKEESCTHNWGEYKVVKESSCTEDGKKERVCTNCGGTESEIIKATHSYGQSTITVSATCVKDGESVSICSSCGDKKTEVIPATGVHSYKSWEVVTKESCTEDGQKKKICKNCSHFEYETIPATGHSWGDYSVTVEPTCTVKGTQEHTCSICKITEEESIPATGHKYKLDYKAATCTKDGYSKTICNTCNDVKESTVLKATGHSWGTEFVTTTEPTYRTVGYSAQVCTNNNCSEVNEENKIEIPRTSNPKILTEYLYANQSQDSYISLESPVCLGGKLGYGYGYTVDLVGHRKDGNHIYLNGTVYLHKDSVYIELYNQSGDKVSSETFNYDGRLSKFTKDKFIDITYESLKDSMEGLTKEKIMEMRSDQIYWLENDRSWFKSDATIKTKQANGTYETYNPSEPYMYIGFETLQMMFYDMGYLLDGIRCTRVTVD